MYIYTHTELLVDWIDQAIHLLFKIAILHTVLYTPTFFNTSDNEHLSQPPATTTHQRLFTTLYFLLFVSLKRKKIKIIRDLQVVLSFSFSFLTFFLDQQNREFFMENDFVSFSSV
jgi:hypothetical protein